jgi:thioredoxin-dependent peroxiredoxin
MATTKAKSMKQATKKAVTPKAAPKKTAVKKVAVKKTVTQKVAAPEIALLAIGSTAPDFSLKSDEDKTVSLSSLRGKTVVLYFYPKDATPGCTQQACDFRDNLARVKAKGALVFGVSADSVDSHRRFKEKQSLNFPLLSDPDKKALNAYKVWQEKSLYGRKFMGIVRTTYIINGQGKIAHVIPKVKVGGHADAVLSLL